jgi:dihydropteroate synthase
MIKPLTIHGKTFDWGSRTYIMGILNITPDSFSGDGLMHFDDEPNEPRIDMDIILERGRYFVQNGADILDIGGESTRPGARMVSAKVEMERVIPVIDRIASTLDVLISIDTYKAIVAEEAINHGAHLVNDIWGLKADRDLAGVIAKNEIPAILMHNRSSWAHAEIKEQLGGRYVGIPYENLMEEVKQELLESVDIALDAGIREDQIILDPGIGFGKSVEQNLELVNRLNEFRDLGYPILLGPSRKSFIGYTLNLPPDQRLEGTAAAIAVGISRGADIVRFHDFPFMTYVTRMTDAIVRRNSAQL